MAKETFHLTAMRTQSRSFEIEADSLDDAIRQVKEEMQSNPFTYEDFGEMEII